MKKLLLLSIIAIFFNSCSKEIDCCTVIDIGMDIKYLNTDGENLFEIPTGYKESDITIYHKTNDGWEKYYEGNLDNPNGISTVEREDGIYLRIIASTTMLENNFSETKIEFSHTDFDIIKTEIQQNNTNTHINKVWYNGTLKWEAYDTERMFEVIK